MAQIRDPLLWLTVRIVVAYIEHNHTSRGALHGLIRDVYQALARVDSVAVASPARKAAAGETVFDDHLVCLECGVHMKILKRHLQTVHDMTPAEYRAKFSLPRDHPLVARRYAALRSSLAKQSGLGKRTVVRGR